MHLYQGVEFKKTHLLSNINNYFQFKILIKKEILNINKAISYYIYFIYLYITYIRYIYFILERIENIMKTTKILKAKEIINNAKKIVVLSGAGLDTDSDIPDFRSSNGVYSKVPEEILDINNFYNDTEKTIKFIKENLFFTNHKPNSAHYILADLENKNKEIKHITQNVTTFLEDAGVTNVLHIHGVVHTSKCDTCGKEFNTANIYTGKECDCDKYSIVRPNIVFYGETIREEFDAFKWVGEADLLLILGTSLKVYPVANLPQYTKKNTPIILITESKTYLDSEENVLKFSSNISETLQEILYLN